MSGIRWLWVVGVTTLLLVAGCGGDDSAARSVVVVTPDEVAEIVIIGEIEKPESVVEAPVVDAAPTTVVVEGGGDEEEGAVVVDGGVAEVVSVKPTVPLTAAEDDPLEGLADSFGDFIDCMLLKGFDLGDPADPSFTQKIMDGVLNDEAFTYALEKCGEPSGVMEAQEEFMASYSDLIPEQIREENEKSVLFADCMGGRGWQMDLLPDENGLLVPDEDNMTPPSNVDPSNVMVLMTEDLQVCGEQLAEELLGQTGNQP